MWKREQGKLIRDKHFLFLQHKSKKKRKDRLLLHPCDVRLGQVGGTGGKGVHFFLYSLTLFFFFGSCGASQTHFSFFAHTAVLYELGLSNSLNDWCEDRKEQRAKERVRGDTVWCLHPEISFILFLPFWVIKR